jgi:hypothetical protein
MRVSACIPSLLSPDEPLLVIICAEEVRGRASLREITLSVAWQTQPQEPVVSDTSLPHRNHIVIRSHNRPLSPFLKRRQSAAAWRCTIDNLASYHHLTLF